MALLLPYKPRNTHLVLRHTFIARLTSFAYPLRHGTTVVEEVRHEQEVRRPPRRRRTGTPRNPRSSRQSARPQARLRPHPAQGRRLRGSRPRLDRPADLRGLRGERCHRGPRAQALLRGRVGGGADAQEAGEAPEARLGRPRRGAPGGALVLGAARGEGAVDLTAPGRPDGRAGPHGGALPRDGEAHAQKTASSPTSRSASG
jgi:hypothetical protein